VGSDGAVLHKDVVVTLLGASATLVGLILVFVGLVVGAYVAVPGDADQSVRANLRRTAAWTLLPFGLGLIQIGIATVWLLRQFGCLYFLTVGFFIATLVTLAWAAFRTLRELMWD
jgi:hypothetical protein